MRRDLVLFALATLCLGQTVVPDTETDTTLDFHGNCDRTSASDGSEIAQESACAASLLQQAKSPVSKLQHPAVPNLCIDKRLAPELFVVGAQKSGTTSLSEELFNGSTSLFAWADRDPWKDSAQQNATRVSLMQSLPRWWNLKLLGRKEHHIFDWYWGGFNKTRWLSRFPTCQYEQRAVSVEMTPILHTPAVPERIVKWYGDLTSRLTIVALLRKPLARMQSSFYHTKRFNGVKALQNVSFKEYVTNVLQDPSYCERKVYNDSVKDEDAYCDSLYDSQLRHWFTHISGKQFTVAPFRLVTGGSNTAAFADSLYAKLGLQREFVVGEVHEGNQSHKAPLEEDLGEDLRMRIETVLPSARNVASVLASSGALLYNFVGDPTNVDAVTEWLSANW